MRSTCLRATSSINTPSAAERRLDPLSPTERSERMGRVKGRNTNPELMVRSLLTRLGYRYRIHYRELPGRPDIAFPGRRKVIWVHGCFWHRHHGCSLARLPKTRADFWVPKLEGNKLRDGQHQEKVRSLGWEVMLIWECELRDLPALKSKVEQYLEP